MSSHNTYRAARDLMLSDPASFAWPSFDSCFNWAHDWFDFIAEGNTATALHIVEQDGSERAYTFDELRKRSNRVARWLAWH
ncbi:MAG TPA: AMP-dependent synthetase, partial [Lentzea sp.]